MDLTPKEQKRLNRLERIARTRMVWDYLLGAVLVVALGIGIYCILTNQKSWAWIFLLSSAAIFRVLIHMRDTRFLVGIIKKLQH